MLPVLRTGRAEADLEEILQYLSEYSTGAAEKLARNIDQRCRVLSANPLMGRAREELGSGIRSLVVDKYLLFYRIRDDSIRILRILYGSRKVTRKMVKE
jgi:toxin ParE1/3/4